MKFTDNQDFINLLESKKKYIQQKISDGVQETPQFQLLRTLLGSYRQRYKETDYRLVLISKDELHKLIERADQGVNQLFQDQKFLTNRTVKINSNIQIVESNNNPFPASNNDARRFFAMISKNSNLVCFLIDPDSTINYFIDGNEYGDGVFYSLSAQRSYEKLKTIDLLEDVLNDYRNDLKNQNTYIKFFVSKSQIKALKRLTGIDESDDQYIKNHKHLLRNKPEECLKNDLSSFIRKNMKVEVHKELLLEDLDRLDIELLDEAGLDLYFLEIKWVGECINADGNGLGIEYKAKTRINPDAVLQVLGYIDQLFVENQNIKLGYLVVFDARKDDLPDTGNEINFEDVPENLKKHCHRFRKLNDFRIRNINPR